MLSIQNVLSYTKTLSLLYAEDETSLREQFTKTFQKLFHSVTACKDGKEALELYQNNKFDLLITDINMPNLNGIELSKKIKELNPEQSIIVISAHNDSDYLIELINYGVDGFLVKPVETQRLFSVLYKSCKVIYNDIVIDKYQQDLEDTIQKLEVREKSLQIKTKQIAHQTNKITKTPNTSDKEREIFYQLVLQEEIDELVDLLGDLDFHLILVFENEHNDGHSQGLIEAIKRFAIILLRYNIFLDVSNQIKDFTDVMSTNVEKLDRDNKDIYYLLETFIFTLNEFVNNVFLTPNINPTFYNKSIISDLNIISSHFLPQSENDENEMELF